MPNNISRNAFVKNFENKVKQTIKKYKLLDKNDRVVVACSGGKDSTTVLYLLKKFAKAESSNSRAIQDLKNESFCRLPQYAQRSSASLASQKPKVFDDCGTNGSTKLGYTVEALIIDLKIGEWSDKNLKNLQDFCKKHMIKLHVIDVRDIFGSSMCHIKSIAKSKNEEMNACMVCGVIKKWVLNRKARELGATRISTGHNLDDEAQTVFLNMLKASPELSIGTGPKIGIVEDERFVQRIKPLFFCSEKETRKYAELMEFPVQFERCPCHVEGFRKQIRALLNELEEKYPGTKTRIVDNFMSLLPCLRKKYFTGDRLMYCEKCGEPSRQNICKACRIFEMIS